MCQSCDSATGRIIEHNKRVLVLQCPDCGDIIRFRKELDVNGQKQLRKMGKKWNKKHPWIT